jgi:hypothetical protein
LFTLAVATLSCRSEPMTMSGEPMAITDVIANIDSLDGRTVRVAGYLGECLGYECKLFRNESEKAQWDRYISEIIANADAGREPRASVAEPPVLGIGSGEDVGFDRIAAPHTDSYVVITGRVTNTCRHNGRPACTDRSTDLEPTAIEPWRRTGGAAQKGEGQ